MIDKRTIKVALLLLMIFIAGGFCGWWIGSSTPAEAQISLPPVGPRPALVQKERILDEFSRELRLTPDQRERVDAIMTEWAREHQRVNMENLRSKQTAFEKFSPFVRTNLNTGQKKIYDSMTDQIKRRQRRAMQNQ